MVKKLKQLSLEDKFGILCVIVGCIGFAVISIYFTETREIYIQTASDSFLVTYLIGIYLLIFKNYVYVFDIFSRILLYLLLIFPCMFFLAFFGMRLYIFFIVDLIGLVIIRYVDRYKKVLYEKIIELDVAKFVILDNINYLSGIVVEHFDYIVIGHNNIYNINIINTKGNTVIDENGYLVCENRKIKCERNNIFYKVNQKHNMLLKMVNSKYPIIDLTVITGDSAYFFNKCKKLNCINVNEFTRSIESYEIGSQRFSNKEIPQINNLIVRRNIDDYSRYQMALILFMTASIILWLFKIVIIGIYAL